MKKSKKDALKDLLSASLDSHNTRQADPAPIQPGATAEPVKKAFRAKKPEKRKPIYSKRRTGIQLSAQDTEVISKVTAILMADGTEGINTSRILKLGLLLCEKADKATLLETFGQVLGSDGRMRREG